LKLPPAAAPVLPDPRLEVVGGFCWSEPEPAPVQVAGRCIGWRQTGGCNPAGGREPDADVGCDEMIVGGWSGYCACEAAVLLVGGGKASSDGNSSSSANAGSGGNSSAAVSKVVRVAAVTCDHHDFSCATACVAGRLPTPLPHCGEPEAAVALPLGGCKPADAPPARLVGCDAHGCVWPRSPRVGGLMDATLEAPGTGGCIPRLVHQTWRHSTYDGDNLQDRQSDISSWVRINSDMRYRMWNDTEARDLVAEHLPALLNMCGAKLEIWMVGEVVGWPTRLH
jgi:hypothetical protein